MCKIMFTISDAKILGTHNKSPPPPPSEYKPMGLAPKEIYTKLYIFFRI